jgi:hypothetical protein
MSSKVSAKTHIKPLPIDVNLPPLGLKLPASSPWGVSKVFECQEITTGQDVQYDYIPSSADVIATTLYKWDPRALRHLLDLSQKEFSWERTIHHMYKENITRRGDRVTVGSFPLLIPLYGPHLSDVFCRLVVKRFLDARPSTRSSFPSTSMTPGNLPVAFSPKNSI